jgi:excinuclease ABC subunit B
MKTPFQLAAPFQPAGDQPQAIEKIVSSFQAGQKRQVLMGATGTGKTFTAANVIAALNRPALVLSHNKTLAAQLYKEFKGFFPHNAVHYFISYYDYYQPEAYIPQRDIYIEKDSQINENIDRLRLAATSALVSREDVIIVASVSCIYGLGSPSDYKRMMVYLKKGDIIERDKLLLKLVDIQYDRNDTAFERGRFRVRGDVVEVWPAAEEFAFRIELFGDEIENLTLIHPGRRPDAGSPGPGDRGRLPRRRHHHQGQRGRRCQGFDHRGQHLVDGGDRRGGRHGT